MPALQGGLAMDRAALPAPDEVRLAIIGLGYVGLPLAVGFGRVLPTVGFDVNRQRVAELKQGRDHTLEVLPEDLRASQHLRCSDDAKDLDGRSEERRVGKECRSRWSTEQ